MSDFNPDEYLAKKSVPETKGEAASEDFNPDKYLTSKLQDSTKSALWSAAKDFLTGDFHKSGQFPVSEMTVSTNPLLMLSSPASAGSPIVAAGKALLSGTRSAAAAGKAAYSAAPEIVKDVAPIVAGEVYDKALGDNHGRSSGIGLAILRRVISKGKH